MTQKIKIAFVVNTLKQGGVEKYVVDMVNMLDSNFFQPSIICLHAAEGLMASRITQEGVLIHELHRGRGAEPMLPFRISTLLQDERIDVVQSHNWSTVLESTLGALLSRGVIPVHCQQGVEYNEQMQPGGYKTVVRGAMRRWLSSRIAGMAAVSEDCKRYLCTKWGASPGKVTVVHNGVDLGQFSRNGLDTLAKRREIGLEQDEFVVGTVGRFKPVKNFPSLVKSMSGVVQQVPKARLLMIGGGKRYPELEPIQRLTRELDLESRVIILKERDDVAELLSIMDTFVLPSFSEGLPQSLLEAMAMEVPVIATRVGGIPDIVNSSDVGILVESNNPDALAEAIIHVARDEEVRATLGRAGRSRVEQEYSLQGMVHRYEQLYSRIVNDRSLT